eukprot:1184448-Amphidinium_carterae.1
MCQKQTGGADIATSLKPILGQETENHCCSVEYASFRPFFMRYVVVTRVTRRQEAQLRAAQRAHVCAHASCTLDTAR